MARAAVNDQPKRPGASRIGRQNGPEKPEKSRPHALSSDALTSILAEVSAASGVRFDHYRREPLTRAIAQQMHLAGFSDPRAYLEWLRDLPDRARDLEAAIRNRTTRFFRDPEVYAALKRDVIEPLVRSRRKDGPIRIWVVGCATGEEAYSIGILLLEALGEEDLVPRRTIFATDISPGVLARARAGIYPAQALRGMSPERLERFFLRANGGSRVVQPLRNLCVFSRRDVMLQFPFRSLDLISCRNVLIYLTPEARRATLERLVGALKPGGYLVLGLGETPNSKSPRFDQVNHCAIYRKK